MKKVQSQSTSNPTSISQAAAEAALNGPQDCIQNMLAAFKSRHDKVVERLNTISGITCLPSQGTFYAFPDVSGFMDRLDATDDVALTELILEKTGVALVPGSAFGASGFIRLSYATSMAQLDDAIDRLASL